MHAQPPTSVLVTPWVSSRAAGHSPVRAALRTATHATHERMHRLEPFLAILDGRLYLDKYLPLIQSLLVYHSAIASAAAQCGLADLSNAESRLALLESDLRSVGGVPLRQSFGWQPATPELALGALYSAEGSMLGGRVIAAQLDYLFGSVSAGRQFFLGSRNDNANWRRLLSALEERCTTASALDETISGALFGFKLFGRCISRHCAI